MESAVGGTGTDGSGGVRRDRGTLALGLLLLALAAAVRPATAARVLQDPGTAAPAGTRGTDDPETAALLAEERKEAELERRRGKPEAALARFEELLDADEHDHAARLGVARALLDLDRLDAVAREAGRVLDATDGKPEQPAQATLAREALRVLLDLATRRGEAAAILARIEALRTKPDPDDPRDAWSLGRAALEAGRRPRALETFARGARAGAPTWEALLARAACQRALGQLPAASQSLVKADELAVAEGTSEPDVLAALADLYFEADGEVAGETERRSPAKLYEEALRRAPGNEAAALGQYRLLRYNWQRQRMSAQKALNDHLARRPDSIEALILAVRADLDDGQLKAARERLKKLDELAPRRRAVRTLHATLLWIEHRQDDCRKILAELVAEDAHDSDPEREVGKHLLELYRFAEGLPFVRAATERDASDWEAWKQLGRALANTGDETAALAALKKADEAAGGRQDAWRHNMKMVLERMAAEHAREGGGDLAFAWNENAAEILRIYLVPFYTESRTELARRYGFTPGPTAIEVFAKHQDFSVRSTGFEGFPALGVCFGPVVTAVSPLCEMRGTFSWARTSYHEFTHVIHLGLSHNRCPRWITEGLATWEEVEKNPAWTRNMRRDLVDALANDELIPVRELNRAFRGPRILFGYYQGGLLCEMLIERTGFPPMVRLLEAFDRGADVDQAFQSVFQTTPEAVDRDFREFVARKVMDLRIEPRWSAAKVQRLRLSLPKKRPAEEARVAAWADGWCTVAWRAWQDGNRVDAQEALRTLAGLAPQPARAEFLRGEMKLKEGDRAAAKGIWSAAVAAGGEDYRVRMALGILWRDLGEKEEAEKQFLAAEKAFPGYDERGLSAELALAELYTELEKPDEALRAKERWLVYESGAFEEALEVGRWHAAHGRHAQSLAYFQRANEIDPFRWSIHEGWGDALWALGRAEEALREFGVAGRVPAELEGDREAPATDPDRARVQAKEARALAQLGRTDAAAEAARAALELDPECELARTVLEGLR